MKSMYKSFPKNRWSHRLYVAVAAGATLLGGVTNGRSQTITTSYTNNFDSAAKVAAWLYWYDLVPPGGISAMSWDSTVNNGGAPGSGSLLYESDWPGSPAGNSTGTYRGQNQVYGTFGEIGANDFSGSIDGSKYDTITFDVRASADSPTNTQGNLCRLNIGLFSNSNYGIHGSTNIDIPTSATNNWLHIVAAINKADAPNPCQGVAFNINCYGGVNANLMLQSNTPTRLWIDNLQVNRSKFVTPPPTLSTPLADAIPGLNLYLNNQFDRTSLKLQSTTGLGWIGQPDTTYSFTIAKFPNATVYPNNQAHIFVATPDGASSIDYNTTNLVWLNIQGNADGSATAYFRYKIFEKSANSNLFGAEFTNGPLGSAWAGQLASLNASTPIGTWSMTFNQDTNVTLNGPGGSTTSFTLRPEVAAQFADPLNVLFGAQPNFGTATNGQFPAIGQTVILSHASISNSVSGSVMDDDFIADNGFLNTGTWAISAAVASDVQLFPSDPGQKLVKWSIPDTSFGLQVATNLMGPWTVLSGSEAGSPISTFNLAGLRIGLVPSSNLGPNQNFFRMFTRKFTKLQVLMPGETADPGSVTGKTGAPLDQNTNVTFAVTVNAVDPNWFPASYNSDHTIHITSSDGTAALPANADLTGGTATFNVTNNAVGSWTFTASDVTDPTKTANTGSPVKVNP